MEVRKLELYVEREKLEKIKLLLSLDEHDIDEDDDALDLVETLIDSVLGY